MTTSQTSHRPALSLVPLGHAKRPKTFALRDAYSDAHDAIDDAMRAYRPHEKAHLKALKKNPKARETAECRAARRQYERSIDAWTKAETALCAHEPETFVGLRELAVMVDIGALDEAGESDLRKLAKSLAASILDLAHPGPNWAMQRRA